MSSWLGKPEKPPISFRRAFGWAFIAGFFSLWIILAVKLYEGNVPDVGIQSESSLRQKEVKALEEISATLKKIESKLDGRK